MPNPNPFHPPSSSGSPPVNLSLDSELWQPNMLLWTVIPACLFALLPLFAGVNGILSFSAHVASQDPDRFVCGNQILGAWGCLIFGTPLFATAGAVAGTVTAKFLQIFGQSSKA